MDPLYSSVPPSATSLEEEVRNARARHRERLEGLARLSRDQGALLQAQEKSAPGLRAPGLRAPGWREVFLSWLPFLKGLFATESDTAKLEDQLEVAQRRVLTLAHHLDRLSADRSLLLRELVQLDERGVAYGADAQRAAMAVTALERELEAHRERAGLGDSPNEEQREAVLEGLILERSSEQRAFQRGQKRLAAIGHLHREFLQMDERTEGRLSELHAAGTELLDALDEQLARLATEDRARQLADALGSEMGTLRDSVARVNRLASEGAVLLTDGLDRLANEVDLLAPHDPEAVAAEQELAVFLRDRTADQAVARVRQQVALRERLAALPKSGEPE